MKKENVFFTAFVVHGFFFFEHLCLNICSWWISSRTNVFLSRITILKGLYLIGNDTLNAIKENMDASKEYDCLRKDCPFIPDLGLTCKSTDLSIAWINIRSLRKHAIDISGSVHFHTNLLPFPYRNISCLVKIFLAYP